MIRCLRLFVLALVGALLPALSFAQGAVQPRVFIPFKSGGSTVASGSPVSGCTAYSIVTIDASGNLKCDPAAVVNGSVSTAGRSILTIRDTVTDSATSNFLNITGTLLSAGATTAQNGVYLSITGSTVNATQNAFSSLLNATGAVNGDSNAILAEVNTGGGNGGNYGVTGSSLMNVAGKTLVGGRFLSSSINNGSGSSKNYGVIGYAGNNSGPALLNIGSYGGGGPQGTTRIGGYFFLDSVAYSTSGAYTPLVPTGTAALVADNRAIAANIFEARDNGTAVFTIADGGTVTMAANLGSAATTVNSSTGRLTVGEHVLFNAADTALFLGSTTSFTSLSTRTALTPDAPAIGLSATSNSAHLMEAGDISFDVNNGACGTSACTDPGLIIHSAVQDTTQYNHLAAWGQAGGAIKTLTESAATSVVQIPIANLAGAFGKFCYTVKAADATDSQIRGSCIKYTVTAKAGTETCSLNTESATTSDASITETEDGSGSGAITAGTLTYAITCSTSPSNAVDIQINAVSSLTQTTLNVTYKLNHVGPGQPARQ